MVHQDTSHHLRRHAEEVRAVLPIRTVLVHHPQVEFMHQRGGLQSVFVPLMPQEAIRHPAEFVIDQRHQALKSRLIAASPALQQCCDMPLLHGVFYLGNSSAFPGS